MKTFYPRLLLAFVFLIGIACSPSIKNEPGVSLELAEFRKSVLSDVNYALDISIQETEDAPISGKIAIRFDLSDTSIDLPLDFRESEDKLHSIQINGNNSTLIFEHEHILLPKEELKVGTNVVSINFTVGESSLNRNPEFLYSLFVPDRARTAFPLFDQPSLKATYDLTMEIPAYWKALGNAPVESILESDSTSTWVFEQSDLMSSYLFAFVAGEFESVTQTIDGMEMTMLHRETDSEKVARNIDEIFSLHKSSLDWLEDYTEIDYPFKKFDFVLIPSFQYGGMEHTGAIQYRASSLFLDESPSQSQLLSRASLIAHETAHMWFGNLVTMDWFNDVWTKEVYANFMAAKIVNPSFPDINHELNFLVRHYPSSYSVDRTSGANPIRQYLPNLNEAGTMYGAIIYNKAPIMMRQLELLVGEEAFQEGIREYLTTFANANATWPELIEILDRKSDADLKTWSEVWVNTPGRPSFELSEENGSTILNQVDESGGSRVWSQSFNAQTEAGNVLSILSNANSQSIPLTNGESVYALNTNGYGYGLFPESVDLLEHWNQFDEVAKGSQLISAYENMLDSKVNAEVYLSHLTEIIQIEENQLLLNLALGHIRSIYWTVFTEVERINYTQDLETLSWSLMNSASNAGIKRMFFNTWRSIVESESGLMQLQNIWDQSLIVEGLPLSENDFINISASLAIKHPNLFEQVTTQQLEEIKNPDSKRRYEFLIPALSNDQETRDAFFESLKQEEHRQIESWVLTGLNYLHHPLRENESEKYLLPSLELMEEIQQTGDIFFPGRWAGATLSNYSSDSAVSVVNDFLSERPDYNYQLSLKILQSADMLFRMNRIQNQ